MKSCLVDANVWLALAYSAHEHHSAAVGWFEQISAGQAHFCRVTQLALLRLLTNRKVMGRDVRTNRQAWADYDQFLADARVSFTDEPPELQSILRRLTSSNRASHQIWTDAYLGAISIAAGLQVVSFDRDFQHIPGIEALILL